MFTFSVFKIKTNKLTNQKITKVFDRHSFSILIYKLYFTSRRFPCDHVIRSIPLSNVNEKVAMLEEQGGIEADLESFYKKLFLIQDLYASGYRMADVGPDENGLVRNYPSMIEFSKNLKILSFFLPNTGLYTQSFGNRQTGFFPRRFILYEKRTKS